MAALELLSDEGYRADGRRATELRKVRARMGVFAQADGSAYIEQGNTKALAVVYGPHEVSRGAGRAGGSGLGSEGGSGSDSARGPVLRPGHRTSPFLPPPRCFPRSSGSGAGSEAGAWFGVWIWFKVRFWARFRGPVLGPLLWPGPGVRF